MHRAGVPSFEKNSTSKDTDARLTGVEPSQLCYPLGSRKVLDDLLRHIGTKSNTAEERHVGDRWPLAQHGINPHVRHLQPLYVVISLD
jgi:hypothetical protein